MFEAAIADVARLAPEAKTIDGKGLGETLTSAFTSAESAFRQFVTTGKFDFKSLADSILADITRIALRSAILGPIANALSGAFAGGGCPRLRHACGAGGGV